MIKHRFKIDPSTIEAWYADPYKASTLRKLLESEILVEAQAMLEDLMMKSITELTLSTTGSADLDSINALKRNAFLSGYIKAFDDLHKLTEQKYNKKSKILKEDEWSHITPNN